MDSSIVTKLLIFFIITIVTFCLYAYFRVIYPYLDLGSGLESKSNRILQQQITIIDGIEYSYWTNKVTKPSKILVMLPAGPSTGNTFEKYAENLPSNVLIIAPDYPGRGHTDDIPEVDTIPRIAKRMSILLQNVLGERHFQLVAQSFGGTVGTELVKENKLKIDKLFLIATGEFFAPDQKIIYHILFFPATLSNKFRVFYENFLTEHLHIFRDMKNESLKDILEQWLTILDYKIEDNFESKIDTIIVIFEKDKIVQYQSKTKLEKIFKNYKEFRLDLSHISRSFEDESLLGIVKNNI